MKYFLVPTNRDLADYLVFVYLGDDSVVAFDNGPYVAFKLL